MLRSPGLGRVLNLSDLLLNVLLTLSGSSREWLLISREVIDSEIS